MLFCCSPVFCCSAVLLFCSSAVCSFCSCCTCKCSAVLMYTYYRRRLRMQLHASAVLLHAVLRACACSAAFEFCCVAVHANACMLIHMHAASCRGPGVARTCTLPCHGHHAYIWPAAAAWVHAKLLFFCSVHIYLYTCTSNSQLALPPDHEGLDLAFHLNHLQARKCV